MPAAGRTLALPRRKRPFDAAKLYALSGMSLANYLSTAAGGGEAGVSTGFGNITFLRFPSIPAAVGVIRRRLTPSTAGYQQYISSTALVSNYGTGAALIALSSAINPSDVGKIHAYVSRITATSGVLEQAVDGVWNSSTPAMSAYAATAGSVPTRVGLDETGANPATTLEFLGALDFHGVPTRSQIDAVMMLARTLGDVPSKAAADALMPLRNGARGFSTANYLQAGGAGGIRGSASGFWLSFTVRPDAVVGGSTGRLIASGTQASVTGYIAQIVGGSGANLTIIDGAAASRSTPTVPIADLPVNEPVRLTFVFTGSALRAYRNGIKVGGDAACTGYTAPATAMTIGFWGSADASALSLFDLVGGDGFVPTDAEVLTHHQASLTAPADIPGKTTRRYNLNQDVVSAGGSLPTTWLDRVGTDHLTNVGTPIVAISGGTVTHRWSLREALAADARGAPRTGRISPPSIPDSVTSASADAMSRAGTPTISIIDPTSYPRTSYGAIGFSATSRLQSPAGLLNSATLSVELVMTFTSALASGKHVLSNANGSSVVGGFSLYQSANTLNLYSYGAGALVASVVIPAASTGYPRTIKIEYTGSVWRLYLDGVQSGADNGAIHTPSSLALCIGTFGDGSAPSDNIAWHSLRTGTLANPSEHFYDFTLDGSGGPAAGVPATVLDRVGTAHLSRVGTGLQVSQRTDRLWSYETSPILLGTDGATAADYLEAAINALPGDAAGFAVSWFGVILSQSVTSQSRRLFSQRSSTNPGWALSTLSTNASVSFALGGSAAGSSPSGTIAAADVGKLSLFTGVWDGPANTIRLYIKRAQVSSGTSHATGFLANAGVKPQIGRRDDATPDAADGVATFGVAYSLGVPTLTQIQAQYDLVMATERIQLIPGMSGTRIDLTADIAANGNAMPASFADRGTGGVTFSRVGSPAVRAHYARAFTW